MNVREMLAQESRVRQVAIAAAYTLLPSDERVLVDLADGAVVVTLPSLAEYGGRSVVFEVVDDGGGALTFATPNDASNYTAVEAISLDTAGQKVTLRGNGTTYAIEDYVGEAYAATVSGASGTVTANQLISGSGGVITSSNNGVCALAVPGADTVPPGTPMMIKKTGTAGAVTITPGSGTINGAATHAAIDADDDWALFVAIGDDWVLVADGIVGAYTATVSGASGTVTKAQLLSALSKFGIITCSNNGVCALAVPGADTVPSGTRMKIIKSGTAGAVTITPASGTIAGGATHAALDAQSDLACFEAQGSEWVIYYSVIA